VQVLVSGDTDQAPVAALAALTCSVANHAVAGAEIGDAS